MCHGYSKSIVHEKVFINLEGYVNQNSHIDDLCLEKHVNMAYNNDPGFFQIDNATDTIIEDPPLYSGINFFI